MKLSVIIVNYNVKFFLEQCLYSVRKAGQLIDMEVIVVDNNSVDGSIEMIKNKFPEVILIESKINLGFSKGNNLGINIAKGEYVLLLNPDTVVKEDTFVKTVQFLDNHPDGGGLGVKMIDGKGEFLPESKRGLPTPLVAFFKIFGLSALFPKSKLFGKYHLGYLDKEKNHEVDVLSGAYMLLRKTALQKSGLLDETFFMYGEDIDLSYRIQLAGFKNYYCSDTSIIHYKGESTKKSSVNYVMIFYQAMIIFAKKHFSKNNAQIFSFLINIAIYLRAGVAILFRLMRKIFIPALDFTAIYFGMFILKNYWEDHHKYVREPYGPQFMEVMVPIYIACWLLGVYLSGGYDKPIRLSKIFRGLFWGTFIIACFYGFLDNDWRFSRALIVLGAFWSMISLPAIRLFLNALNIKGYKLDSGYIDKRIAIVASEEEGQRILSLLKEISSDINLIGFIDPLEKNENHSENYLGKLFQLKEIIEIYKIQEVIFSTKNVSINSIIDYMSSISSENVDFKIAPEDSLFIIGSNSVDNPGDLYTIGINFSIQKKVNIRNKRFLDVGLSILLLLTYPLQLFLVTKPSDLIKNIYLVLMNEKSWVSYYSLKGEDKNIPKIKSGVLSPIDNFKNKPLDEGTINRLNLLYAKHYHLQNDLDIILKSWKKLGN